MLVKRFTPLVMAASLLVLQGCVTLNDHEVSAQKAPGKSFVSEPKMLASKGIKAIQEGDYDTASTYFNMALKLDTANSYLQFLNAMAYHLRGLKGDNSLFPLAQQGYELAIQFDQSNWLAHYQLGLLYLDQRDFESARIQFAEASLYKANDGDILYNLAVSSYYAQDPQTAAAVLEQLRELEPESERSFRASSIIMAALGEDQKADDYLDHYNRLSGNVQKAAFIKNRVKDWKSFYSRSNAGGVTLADNRPVPQMRGGQQSQETHRQNAPQEEYDPARLDAEEAKQNSQSNQKKKIDQYSMAIVDVVIIRTEEEISTSKGINLLNGLTLQFGTTDSSNAGLYFKKSGSKTVGNMTSTITRAININSIDYSLNIANSNTTRNEILARPTLVAMKGKKSEFFSGVEVVAAAIGGASNDGATVTIKQEIGVKLKLQPEFLDDGRIKLDVEAERTYLTTPNTTSITFSYRVDTSKTTVNANVAMNFGETLILSGLSEKETEYTRDGVPLLQDIPGVQYLFSKAENTDFQKSVLILITPRLPNYVYQSEEAKHERQSNMSHSERVLNDFQERHSDKFRPYPNWESVFNHMQENSMYREFRTGDVKIERWNNQSTIWERLEQAKGFLFF